MTTVFGRSDAKLPCAVMTDSLHRDWPGQVQWVCSQPPRGRGQTRAPGSTPASRQFWAEAEAMQGFSFPEPLGTVMINVSVTFSLHPC
jgi:hypothetical protein